MPKYRVTMKEIVLHELIIEAESETEARETARGIDNLHSLAVGPTEVQDAGWLEVGEIERIRTLREVEL